MTYSLKRLITPFGQSCPNCGKLFQVILADGHKRIGKVVDGDGDIVFYGDRPTPEQKRLVIYPSLEAFQLECCELTIIEVTAQTFNGEVDWWSDFANDYFYNPHSTKVDADYLVTTHGRSWVAQSYASPYGKMLYHFFGMVAWPDRSWIGPQGVAACQPVEGSPWQYAADLVLELWGDLQAMQEELQGTPWTLVDDGTGQERRRLQLEAECVARLRLEAMYDDEIPF